MKHSCRQVSRLVSDSRERRLSVSEKLRLRIHMLMCKLCRNYEKDVHLMSDILDRLRSMDHDDRVRMSDQGRQRIRQALRDATEKNNQGKESAPS